ncbi:Methyltransferase domain-containing protein [Amycolatopsis xylanica]|uniref:Methyltransferase domain-containing protein n=1 Tax=Amycolatopsis xylanica TaxID=589385 RepID=A0A1H3IX33_9PSEU|nr:class I SAM-dependent methyltransferase [Amycolatopsis xylanica]SDY31895.1 Methyltransferase domain-containing protein [Amycolatopsis xylanica]
MITETYRYPDTGDRVTASFIAQHEPYEGYWSASEDAALARLAEKLEALGGRDQVHALDAGCGEGRLLPWIARFAARITAVDPDPERLGTAKTAKLPEGTEVTFQVSPVTGVRGGPFGLIVCSHVIQHVPTADLQPLLDGLRAVAAPGASLVLSFSRAPFGRGGYSIDRIAPEGVRSEHVGQTRFDEALASGEALPVRLVDPEQLTAMAAEAGWEPVWDWTYHVLDDLGVVDEHTDRDELVNAAPALRRQLGRDMVTLWRAAPTSTE